MATCVTEHAKAHTGHKCYSSFDHTAWNSHRGKVKLRYIKLHLLILKLQISVWFPVEVKCQWFFFSKSNHIWHMRDPIRFKLSTNKQKLEGWKCGSPKPPTKYLLHPRKKLLPQHTRNTVDLTRFGVKCSQQCKHATGEWDHGNFRKALHGQVG